VDVIGWRGQGRGFLEWGKTRDGVFGVSGKPEILETWKWKEGNLRNEVRAELPEVLDPVILSDGRYVACRPPPNDIDNCPLVLSEYESKNVIHKWAPPPHWYYSKAGTSRNGKHLVVTAMVDPRDPPRNPKVGAAATRFGVVDSATMELRWIIAGLVMSQGDLVEMVVSDDGKLIALGGWNNGVAVLDALAGTVLWSGRPPKSAVPQYVEFSPDGSALYAGDGAASGVYRLETRTGKVLGQWHATASGQPGADRVSCIAVSPDGAWVAAGTAATGLVYLFDTTSKQKPMVLAHVSRGMASILVLSFSPDSRRLASAGGGLIKIWDVPQSTTMPATSRGAAETGPGE
jgi:WD40 repeat protein